MMEADTDETVAGEVDIEVVTETCMIPLTVDPADGFCGLMEM